MMIKTVNDDLVKTVVSKRDYVSILTNLIIRLSFANKKKT